MIETAGQTPCSPQVTNPTFNAVAEALRGAELGLPLTALGAVYDHVYWSANEALQNAQRSFYNRDTLAT